MTPEEIKAVDWANVHWVRGEVAAVGGEILFKNPRSLHGHKTEQSICVIGKASPWFAPVARKEHK